MAEHDIIPFIHIQSQLPSLVDGVTHKLQVPPSLVVIFVGEHSAVEVSQVLLMWGGVAVAMASTICARYTATLT